MESLTYYFSLLSDTFAHGAYQTMNFNRPELRAPSVKGMIRWWHEALGMTKQHSDTLFGQAIGATMASRVTIRVHPTTNVQQQKVDFMPHKKERGGSKNAIQPGTAYQLTLTQRREPLPMDLWEQLQRATEAWLLLGAIGQRSNRAAGSVLWDQAPATQKEFELKVADLLGTAHITFAILDATFDHNRQARDVAGDFLKDEAFGGSAPFGSASPRKPSPLKLKCIQIDGSIRLLAIWDRRIDSPAELTRGVHTLINSNKKIGRLLEAVLPQLTA